MRTFTNQTKGYEKQFAVSYIVYMMGGSCFHKCECKNKLEEKRLFLHYAEMPNQKQIDAENRILKQIERLDLNLLRKFENMKCEAHFIRGESEYFVVFLTGGFENIKFTIRENGDVEVQAEGGEYVA